MCKITFIALQTSVMNNQLSTLFSVKLGVQIPELPARVFSELPETARTPDFATRSIPSP